MPPKLAIPPVVAHQLSVPPPLPERIWTYDQVAQPIRAGEFELALRGEFKYDYLMYCKAMRIVPHPQILPYEEKSRIVANRPSESMLNDKDGNDILKSLLPKLIPSQIADIKSFDFSISDEISVRNTRFGWADLRAVIAALHSTKTVRKLRFHNASLSPSMIYELGESLPFTSIVELSIDFNELNGEDDVPAPDFAENAVLETIVESMQLTVSQHSLMQQGLSSGVGGDGSVASSTGGAAAVPPNNARPQKPAPAVSGATSSATSGTSGRRGSVSGRTSASVQDGPYAAFGGLSGLLSSLGYTGPLVTERIDFPGIPGNPRLSPPSFYPLCQISTPVPASVEHSSDTSASSVLSYRSASTLCFIPLFSRTSRLQKLSLAGTNVSAAQLEACIPAAVFNCTLSGLVVGQRRMDDATVRALALLLRMLRVRFFGIPQAQLTPAQLAIVCSVVNDTASTFRMVTGRTAQMGAPTATNITVSGNSGNLSSRTVAPTYPLPANIALAAGTPESGAFFALSQDEYNRFLHAVQAYIPRLISSFVTQYAAVLYPPGVCDALYDGRASEFGFVVPQFPLINHVPVVSTSNSTTVESTSVSPAKLKEKEKEKDRTRSRPPSAGIHSNTKDKEKEKDTSHPGSLNSTQNMTTSAQLPSEGLQHTHALLQAAARQCFAIPGNALLEIVDVCGNPNIGVSGFIDIMALLSYGRRLLLAQSTPPAGGSVETATGTAAGSELSIAWRKEDGMSLPFITPNGSFVVQEDVPRTIYAYGSIESRLASFLFERMAESNATKWRVMF